MAMQRQVIHRLTFPIAIGDVETEYVIHPVGIDAGTKLAEIFTSSPAQLARLKMKNVELFDLALGVVDPTDEDSPRVWDKMRADGVPLQLAWRAGMSALAHFQVLLGDTTPAAWETASKVAEAVWESGTDPEQLAAYMAATNGTAKTPRSTPRAEAGTTPRRASGTTTTKPGARKPRKAAATPSRGARSGRSGR